MARARETRMASTTRRAKARAPRAIATVAELRRRARQRLASLSPERLQVALDFLAYLEERESSTATDELLRIPGFVDTLKVAEDEAAKAGWADWRKVRRDV
jgi:hypothetical protein